MAITLAYGLKAHSGALSTAQRTSSRRVRQAGSSFWVGGSPNVQVQNIPNSVDFRALFGRRKDHAAAGLTYTVQFSADLVTWQTSTATPTVIADDGVIEACTVPYPFFINGMKARFFQIRVSTAP